MLSDGVAVTGVGVVSALGIGAPSHMSRLWAREVGVSRVPPTARHERFCRVQATVPGFDRRAHIESRTLRKLLTTSAAYAVVAAGEALRSAGLEPRSPALADAGLFAGSVCIDFEPEMFVAALRESIDDRGALDISRFARRGLLLIDPLFLVKTLPNGGVGGIAIEHQVLGPSLNITNGPVSGLQAVLAGLRAVRQGDVEVAVVGAYDSMLSMDSVAEHIVSERLASSLDWFEEPAQRYAARPFDVRGGGFVPGEGAVFLVLESPEHARRRGAPDLGRIIDGWQSTGLAEDTARGAGAHGANRVDALEAAARGCLERAGCSAAEVSAVFGDGTGVAVDDHREAMVYERLFPSAAVPYTAATGSLGFAGAASGVLSLVHALESLRRGEVAPLIGCDTPNPRYRMDLVHAPRAAQLTRALVWNSDQGVKNSALLVGGPA